MNTFFPKIKIGCLNDHFNLLGGGTVHSFKFLEYLKKFYNIDVYVPGVPKTKEWMQQFLHLDIDGINIYPYVKDCGKKYDYMFLNISHWRAEETKALKKYMLIFFPQFYFPLYDYEFLANSEYTKKNIVKRWKQKPEKVHVVYPPIMTSQFNPSTNPEKNILHVSRISPPVPEADKGHRQMIKAFKEMVDNGLKDWTFNIVGQVQDQVYFEELYRIAERYPIKFHIGITFEKLQKLYSNSMIYWHMTGITMPNEAGAQEHFGMTTVEAMASGCVPIVLNTGGQLEIIKDGKDGFLVNDIISLQRKTKFLIQNKDHIKRMSKNAIKRSKDFSEEKTKQRLYSVITKTNKVSIIILCWNNSRFTKDCVDRLYEVTPPGFELILVDNASTDDTWKVIQDLAKKYPNIKTIRNEKNVGFAKGNNIGLKEANSDYICHLNNDTIPQWGWLERLVDILENKPEVGIVGAKLYFDKDNNGIWKIQHAGITFKNNQLEHIGRFQTDKEVRGRGYEEVEAVTGACMLVRKELAGFDEKYTRGYYEDIDLCYDKETQIMTKNGIKYLKDIILKDEIMTYDIKTNKIEYQKPIRTIKKKEKELLWFNNRRVDIQCSRDQNLLVGYLQKEVNFIKAEKLEKKLWNRQSRYFIRTSHGIWDGNNRKIEINGKSYNIELFIRLLAWYLSEGCINQSDKIKYDYGIKIAQSSQKNKEKYNEIVKIISDLGFKPKLYKNIIVFYDKNLYYYFKKFGKSNKKYIPNNIKILSIEYLNKFIQTYIKGDGSIKKNGNFSLFTSSERMKNDLIELLIKTNHPFTFHKNIGRETKFKNGIYKTKDSWTIQCCNQRKNNIAFLPKPKIIKYNDYVYDIEVPNHTIYIIRNGKGCWSSNCLQVRKKGYKVVLNHESKLIHFEGKSQDILKKEDNKEFEETAEKNKERFEKKWHIGEIKSLPKISIVPDLTGISHEEKAEIGGGERPIHNDYGQVDLRKLPHIKYTSDARLLPFLSNSLTNICSSYMICCLKKEEAEIALKEWFRCLKPGGRLELYIPDLFKITKQLIATKDEELLKEIYGEQKHELDFYQWGYTFETMDALLSRVNFVRVTKTASTLSRPNSLGILTYKPL